MPRFVDALVYAFTGDDFRPVRSVYLADIAVPWQEPWPWLAEHETAESLTLFRPHPPQKESRHAPSPH